MSEFAAEKAAIQYCEQYGIERGTKEYSNAINAFTVGYRYPQAGSEAVSAELALLYRTLLERALPLLTDEQIAEVFAGVDVEANSVPIDEGQLRRIAELVKDVAV